MDIWALDKLFLFIGFVIPGFITLKVYELLVPGKSGETSKQLIDAIAYSCINYAILFAPIYWVQANAHVMQSVHLYIAFYTAVLLVFPMLWPILWMLLRKTQIAQKWLPHPTEKPWDYVFNQRKHYWIIATLRDGRKIAGRYADSSFASSAPAEEQLYLEEVWELNGRGGFHRCREKSCGILIMASDLVSVELFAQEYPNG